MSSIDLDKIVNYKLGCLSSHGDYIAYCSDSGKGMQIVLVRLVPQKPIYQTFDCSEESVRQIRFISYKGQILLSIIFETYVKFMSLDGSLQGFFQEQPASQVTGEDFQDWFTSIVNFQEQKGKEVLVLSSRTGRLFVSIAAGFGMQLKTSTKRNISSMLTVGSSIVASEESGKLLRLTRFSEGFNKQLLICPQKFPATVLEKYSNTQVLAGLATGELLLVDIVNMDIIWRIQAHANLISGVVRLGDFILTCSQDGHTNKIKMQPDGQLTIYAPSNFNRILSGIFVVGGKPYVSCYELSMLIDFL